MLSDGKFKTEKIAFGLINNIHYRKNIAISQMFFLQHGIINNICIKKGKVFVSPLAFLCCESAICKINCP